MPRGSAIENDTVFGVICQLPLLREEFRIPKLTFYTRTCGAGRPHVGLCPALLVIIFYSPAIKLVSNFCINISISAGTFWRRRELQHISIKKLSISVSVFRQIPLSQRRQTLDVRGRPVSLQLSNLYVVVVVIETYVHWSGVVSGLSPPTDPSSRRLFITSVSRNDAVNRSNWDSMSQPPTPQQSKNTHARRSPVTVIYVRIWRKSSPPKCQFQSRPINYKWLMRLVIDYEIGQWQCQLIDKSLELILILVNLHFC